MSKTLTKDARWIIFWLQLQSDTPLSKPFEVVMNTGRWSYDVSTEQAFRETIDLNGDKLLAFKSYMVDVQLFPYEKQHKDVTELAERWFKNHGATLSTHRESIKEDGESDGV